MAAKFKLDAEDFDFVKHSKEEQAQKAAKGTREKQVKEIYIDIANKQETKVDNMDVDIIDNHNMDVDIIDKHKTNIYKLNKHKTDMQPPLRARIREPQSVAALRDILLEKLGGQKEIIVKMADIAKEINFSLSWMQFAMKYLAERNEFVFVRYAKGKSRGMKVIKKEAAQ